MILTDRAFQKFCTINLWLFVQFFLQWIHPTCPLVDSNIFHRYSAAVCLYYPPPTKCELHLKHIIKKQEYSSAPLNYFGFHLPIIVSDAIKLPQWSTILLKKSTVTQLVTKCPHLSWNLKVAIFTTANQRPLSWATQIQLASSCLIY
jgi:hypothetical protein